MLIWVAADENPRLGGLRAKNDKKCSGTPKYNTTDTFLSKVHLKDTYSSICVVCVSISQDKASLSILNSVRNRKKKNNKIKQFFKNLPWNPVNTDKCPFKRALRKNVTDTWCIDLKTKADIYKETLNFLSVTLTSSSLRLLWSFIVVPDYNQLSSICLEIEQWNPWFKKWMPDTCLWERSTYHWVS